MSNDEKRQSTAVAPEPSAPPAQRRTPMLEPPPGTSDLFELIADEPEVRQASRTTAEHACAIIQRYRLAVDKLSAQLAEATGAKLRVGDIMGENEHLRSRVAELEAALGFAERELCRMKRGRR